MHPTHKHTHIGSWRTKDWGGVFLSTEGQGLH